MSAIVKSGTMRFSQLVGKDVAKLRSSLTHPPKHYQLSARHKRLVDCYVDSSYSKVVLKSGYVVRTKSLQAVEIGNKYSLQEGFSGIIVSLDSFIMDRYNYHGVLHGEMWARLDYNRDIVAIQLPHPVYPNEFLIDAYIPFSYFIPHVIDTNNTHLEPHVSRWLKHITAVLIWNNNSIIQGVLSDVARDTLDVLLSGIIVDVSKVFEKDASIKYLN